MKISTPVLNASYLTRIFARVTKLHKKVRIFKRLPGRRRLNSRTTEASRRWGEWSFSTDWHFLDWKYVTGVYSKKFSFSILTPHISFFCWKIWRLLSGIIFVYIIVVANLDFACYYTSMFSIIFTIKFAIFGTYRALKINLYTWYYIDDRNSTVWQMTNANVIAGPAKKSADRTLKTNRHFERVHSITRVITTYPRCVSARSLQYIDFYTLCRQHSGYANEANEGLATQAIDILLLISLSR